MSGGFYDYAYARVEDFASHPSLAKTAERRAFAALLSDVAEAMHDVEWVDSDDYAPGDENAAIERCLSKEILLEQVIADAHEAAAALTTALQVFHQANCRPTESEEPPCTTQAMNATAVNAE